MTDSDSLFSALPRVEEIRSDNHRGDVSYKDIEWLCDTVERFVRGSSSSLTPGAGDATQVVKDGQPGRPSDSQPRSVFAEIMGALTRFWLA